MKNKKKSVCKWDYDCVVLGGGPGGLVSALYLKRFDRSVALVKAGKPRAAWIPRTHNLMGYDRGISGPLLLKRLYRQVSKHNLEQFTAEGKVFNYSNGFRIELDSQRSITARKVILATGFRDMEPELENLYELRAKGLLRYCSICDGYEYRNEPIAILAKDDFGVQKGLFISHWTKDIRFILPESFQLASQRIQEIKTFSGKVSRCKVLKILACNADREGLEIFMDSRKSVYARVAYVEFGCLVNSSAFMHLQDLNRTKEGFIITTTEQRTSIPGLFAVGDCVNLLGQISVAAGQAAVAATTIHNDLFNDDFYSFKKWS